VKLAGGKPVIVDPKRRDFSAYRGASVLTPNLSELEQATGRSCATTREIVEAAEALLPELAGSSVLVTRGPGGMSLVEPNKPAVHVPARARAVFDVTGAGDTVVGTLALALAVGLPMTVAIDVASAAAAIAVSKPGTATVTVDELRAEFDHVGGSRS
jgi:D-beta-D-heptose 7-phosphate kinase/D-beta-D-heptose 1-phosphate adenosyltransferase